tara:strand:+ start:224 stop:1213 length:990 start_codon:yes stop_codon:yes gene_type:complete
MANYKDLHGFQIKHLSSNPPAPLEGEIWYNTTTQTLKVAPAISAWASGNNMNTARSGFNGQAYGTKDSSLASGGSATTKVTTTEEYDGTDWTASNNMNTARNQMAGFGIQTAAVAAGGQLQPTNQTQATEEYNGTSWTSVTNTPQHAYTAAGAGILTAGVIFGGQTAPGGDPGQATNTNVTLEYDGTNWTSGGNINTVSQRRGGAGTQTAALAISGDVPTANVEQYDGSSWTEGPNVNTARGNSGASGTTTSALFFGGYPNIAHSETYDGSSWTEGPNLGTARYGCVGAGNSNTSALAAGGGAGAPSSVTAATEEFSQSATVRTVDTSS